MRRKFAKWSRESCFCAREIPELGRELPGCAARGSELQTDHIGCESVGGTSGPSMSMGGVGIIAAIGVSGTIAEGTVGEVAFYAGRCCSGGVVEIPTPSSTGEIKCSC